MYPNFDPYVQLNSEPSADARFREEYYEKREKAEKSEAHPSVERGLAAHLRANTQMRVGRFISLI